MIKKAASILIILALLLAQAACGAPAQGANLAPASVTVTGPDGKETAVTLATLQEANPVEFTTEQGTSKSKPVKETHKGVLLKELITKLGYDASAVTTVTVTATDGFQKAYSGEQIRDPEKLYLVYETDGKPLSDEAGKTAAFYIVARNEQFKQNWTKYAAKIELK